MKIFLYFLHPLHPNPHFWPSQVVVLIGASASGVDIAREVSHVAKEVHLCSRGWTPEDIKSSDVEEGIFKHPMVTRAYSNGLVEFGDGAKVRTDIILHCTG